MNDRELIAEVVHKATLAIENVGDWDELLADAVLTALAGRIIPELPDQWWSVELTKSLLPVEEQTWLSGEERIPHGDVEAQIWMSPPGEELIHSGTGPTIADAITNALESSK